MNPDLFEIVSDPTLNAIELTPEQSQLMAVVKHQMIIQDQFNQLTKHCELLYTRVIALEKALANRVLS